MNIISVNILLGLTTCVVQADRSKESPKVSVSVWPPGPIIYLEESVVLRCNVTLGTQFIWTYHWFQHDPHTAPAPNPRHLVSGNSYAITGVTMEDGGSYRCQAEGKGRNSSMLLLSDPAKLTVSELSPPLLTILPSSRQLFRGRRFTVQCPVSEGNTTGWTLRQLSQDFGVRTADLDSGLCSPLEGTVSEAIPMGCVFPHTYSGNSGLYWCEHSEGRSNAVNITVSYGDMIIKSPAHTVSEGDEVILYCEYWNGTGGETTFSKDGVDVFTHSSYSSKNIIEMHIYNTTHADEGFYKCKSSGKMESPEAWLSVKRNVTVADGLPDSTDSSWKWIVLYCCIVVLLFLLLVIGWLVHRYRYQIWWAQRCWPFPREGPAHIDPPKTKQDVTEVQWDLPWMEMSNLLDKQVYTGT